MRVFKKSSARLFQTSQPNIETNTWRIEYSQNASTFKAGNGNVVIVEGDLYYYLDEDGKSVHFQYGNYNHSLLKKIYDSLGSEGFSEKVEGIYNVAVVNQSKDTVLIFGDAFNRSNIFYPESKDLSIVSTNIRDVLTHMGIISYEPMVLCCMLILGYSPAKHTPYQGLRRLAVGERLLAQNGHIKANKSPVNPSRWIEMEETHHSHYAEIFENAIISGSSPNENWVEVSGGWDSTIILGTLRKYFDASKVRAIVQAINFKDGQCYNPYEVDKSIEIGKYYDIPVDIVVTDLGSPALPDIWANASKAQLPDLGYDWLPAYHIMADFIKQNGKQGASVYVGSYSDAIHNFGFSQFSAFPYLNYDFRAYSDKIKSYLYSPSFLKKIIDGTFEDDFAYKLFRWHHSAEQFSDVSQLSRSQRIFEYLLPFVIANSRIPFASIATDPIFLPDTQMCLKDWLYEHYFKEVVELIEPGTVYFWLLRLYQYFHLQGTERIAVKTSLQGAGQRPCWPFYDLRMVRFMEKMPENWGRGLEWLPTKYPLKHYGCNNIKIPYEIVESSAHSYIDELEEGHSIDWRSEVINNSTLTLTSWASVRAMDNLDQFFDKDWFDIPKMKETIQTGRDECGNILTHHLLTILSMGFEGE